MTYGTIDAVRRIAGKRPQKIFDIKIGEGDGSETEFDLNMVGQNEAFLLDQDQQTSSTPVISLSTSDVTAYVNDVAVTVSSVNGEKGSIILDVAPTLSADVSADYWHSDVSDEMIIEKMQIAKEMVDEYIDGSLTAGQSLTFERDGDGYKTIYEMPVKDVTAITSVSVSGSAKTEGTHYEIYYHDNLQTRISHIKFKTAPSNKLNTVSISITHGQTKYSLVHLSNLFSAKLLLIDNYDQGIVGESKKSKDDVSNVRSRLIQINYEIKDILKLYNRRDMINE